MCMESSNNNYLFRASLYYAKMIQYYFLYRFKCISTDNILLCGCRFEPAKYIIRYIVTRKHYFRIF